VEHGKELVEMQIIKSKRSEVESEVEQLNRRRMNSQVRKISVLFNCYKAW
jgi:hypothetical protein